MAREVSVAQNWLLKGGGAKSKRASNLLKCDDTERWERFAREVVERAGALEEETHEILLHAFRQVARDRFLDAAFQVRAAEDVALPIGAGQSSLRPSLIARMLAVIGLRKGMRILAVGCGSGYSSALMARAGAHVFAIEQVRALAQQTRRRLDALNLQNILIKCGAGARGWPEHAPYDSIVVLAPCSEGMPLSLLSQLGSQRGRMIAPIGGTQEQRLTLWEARDGQVSRYTLETLPMLVA